MESEGLAQEVGVKGRSAGARHQLLVTSTLHLANVFYGDFNGGEEFSLERERRGWHLFYGGAGWRGGGLAAKWAVAAAALRRGLPRCRPTGRQVCQEFPVIAVGLPRYLLLLLPERLPSGSGPAVACCRPHGGISFYKDCLYFSVNAWKETWNFPSC